MSRGSGPKWVLLPGMDGIGRFRALREAARSQADCRALSYPPDRPLGYDELAAQVRAALRQEDDYVLVAESFSGPIAIRLAAERPPGLRALVLAASFCASPLAGLRRAVLRRAGGAVFRLRPPRFLVRYFLLGRAPQAAADDLYASVAQVRGEVFAVRLRNILTVNVCADLARVDVPVLYLQATRDRLVGDRAVQAVRAACPQLELRRIAAPHMVLQTHAAEAVGSIHEFLVRHKISTPPP